MEITNYCTSYVRNIQKFGMKSWVAYHKTLSLKLTLLSKSSQSNLSNLEVMAIRDDERNPLGFENSIFKH